MDIVERLRARYTPYSSRSLKDEAAAEIERLRAAGGFAGGEGGRVMTVDEKLDYIIKRLDQLSDSLDPYPGYVQRADGVWYNKVTGLSQYDEAMRVARQAWEAK